MTSVEWLVEELDLDAYLIHDKKIEKALEMEKKQMATNSSQLTDEEIEKAAFEYIKPPQQQPCKSDGYNEYDVFAAFRAGIKYREQLKQRK
jgi:hypothetical protein